MLEKRYAAENKQDNKSLQTNTFLKISSIFERQAVVIYTKRIFKKFQNEILEMTASNAKLTEEVDNFAIYLVKSFEKIEVNEIEMVIVKKLYYFMVQPVGGSEMPVLIILVWKILV